MRLSVGLHHGSFSGTHHRNECSHRSIGVVWGPWYRNNGSLGGFAISVIGAANIIGTLLAGWAGKRFGKKWLLSGIYAGRSIAAAWFILTPITADSVLIFSFSMGFLWLATVPLTSGLVAHIYGVRYMATLYGIVFFSHQLGSFVGVYLGGVLYDMYGSYTTVWWIGIAVGVFSSLIHLPVREEPRLKFQPN